MKELITILLIFILILSGCSYIFPKSYTNIDLNINTNKSINNIKLINYDDLGILKNWSYHRYDFDNNLLINNYNGVLFINLYSYRDS